jgi:AP-1-like factor
MSLESSSSSTLWATGPPICTSEHSSQLTRVNVASKEWIIPAKPKPGRKPKAAPSLMKDDEVPNFLLLVVYSHLFCPQQLDKKGRRIQNRYFTLFYHVPCVDRPPSRAAQRAFRERKQSQLAELQARVQAYERGEMERNIALQTIAKRLKEENEELRRENQSLKEQLVTIEQERDPFRTSERKRRRDQSLSSSSMTIVERNKRTKITLERPTIGSTIRPSLPSPSYASSPPSMVSSPASNGSSDHQYSPISFHSPPRDMPLFPSHGSTITNIIEFPQDIKNDMGNMESAPYSTFDCGLCNENTPCVCREIALQQSIVEPMALPCSQVPLKMETFSQTTSVSSDDGDLPLSSPSSPSSVSILDNLPAYQPPVPLPRRTAGAAINPIFPITSTQSPSSPACSGDPNNCAACANDSFGRAFCEAIVVANSALCDECPGQNAFIDSRGISTPKSPPELHPQSVKERIPTNDAWRQLKSHPNVAFADLSLLADVVARRSKCTGPRVVISPAPGFFTPERNITPSIAPLRKAETEEQDSTHASFDGQHGGECSSPPPPQFVQQDLLIRCGRQTVREVRAEAVADALRLLDAKYS